MFTNLTIRRNLVQPEKPQPVQPSALTTQRFTLSGGKEAGMNRMPVRLPANRKQIQVVSGCAWITCNGEDVILYTGAIHSLDRNSNEVLISSLGSAPLIFEVS